MKTFIIIDKIGRTEIHTNKPALHLRDNNGRFLATISVIDGGYMVYVAAYNTTITYEELT